MGAEADDAQRRLREKIEAVRARFLTKLGIRLEELRVLTAQAATPDGAEAAAARLALRRGLHNLAGAAPILGLHALGRKAGELEARVIAAPEDDGGLPPDLALEVSTAIASLADLAT
jgi:hypothetical protein